MSELQSTTQYRDVPGFPGYRVGDDGSVWSCRPASGRGSLTDTWRRMKPSATRDKHLVVQLSALGRLTIRKQFVLRQVHRLVLEAFVGPCPEGMECCHHDGNPANNHVSNLRWDTRKGNAADRDRHGHTLRGESHWGAKLTAEAVRQIRADHAAGAKTQRQLSREHGVHFGVIHAVIRRKTWRHV